MIRTCNYIVYIYQPRKNNINVWIDLMRSMEQDQRTIEIHQTNRKRRLINFSSTLSADIITDILSRLPFHSVVQCRHVCKTWRDLIDDPSRRILFTYTFIRPDPIILNILSRLPADSVIYYRCVCKTWQAVIDHPSFAETHTRQLISLSSLDHMGSTKSSASFFLYEYKSKNCEFHFVEFNDNNMFSLKLRKQPITNHPCSLRFRNLGSPYTSSCNGLVFTGSVLSSYVNSFFVCNPFTREYIHLSSSSPKKQGFMVYGFGYHPCTNEYKVVSIHYKSRSRSPGPGWVSVYTLGSGTWRNIGEIQYQLVRNRRPGSLANGALHWMNKDDNKKIVSFDLADEEFRIVPSPPSLLSPNDYVDELGVLEGCLCVTRSDKTRYQSPKEIWVLNQHNNNNDTVNMIDVNPEESRLWTKMEFSIPWKWSNSSVAEPLVILKGGKVLLRDKDGLVSYDPNTKHFNKYEGYFNRCMWFDIIPYTKSFVSLKALGEQDAKSFG